MNVIEKNPLRLFIVIVNVMTLSGNSISLQSESVKQVT
jgi:hypothetical protein